jgi:hypothetical protein
LLLQGAGLDGQVEAAAADGLVHRNKDTPARAGVKEFNPSHSCHQRFLSPALRSVPIVNVLTDLVLG